MYSTCLCYHCGIDGNKIFPSETACGSYYNVICLRGESVCGWSDGGNDGVFINENA